MSSGRTLSLDSPVEYIKGVGPLKGELLRKHLNLHTVKDLLYDFPYRYIDKTQISSINQIETDGQWVQLRGKLSNIETVGKGPGRRLTAVIRDDTGSIELLWFRGLKWIETILKPGVLYTLYGRVSDYKGRYNIVHPEIELYDAQEAEMRRRFEPLYSSVEALDAKGLHSKGRVKLMDFVIGNLQYNQLSENLPEYITSKLKFPDRWSALKWIHFPKDEHQLASAQNRLKFEELFFIQLRLLQTKHLRQKTNPGFQFPVIGDLVNRFYKEIIPYELTNAQKRVIKEIRADLALGKQMNRLLQGDVGSGKTVVALILMLIAIDNGFQASLMAPTEILAQQHLQSLKELIKDLPIQIALLTGSTKKKERGIILEALKNGEIQIIVGTHALLEDTVQFNKLGIAITDEQHRFGVAQRSKLWKKNTEAPPHILVMTATPIPRTLAMTLYGDLDVSIIDELPPNRKPIQTLHITENQRGQLHYFMKEQIALGRQIYIVYPLIEESEKLDLENLNDGYEKLLIFFPRPQYQVSIVHGRMKAADKDMEMQRFIERKTQILIATTVIEVGVNVPNASMMVIENAERFGLSQLHQLRGRVGRGAEQSYCVLMTQYKLSKDAKKRIQTMVETQDGFRIAEADLELRGPGDIEGTRQSGLLDLKLANLMTDGPILQTARKLAEIILEKDPELADENNLAIKYYLQMMVKTWSWAKIS